MSQKLQNLLRARLQGRTLKRELFFIGFSANGRTTTETNQA